MHIPVDENRLKENYVIRHSIQMLRKMIDLLAEAENTSVLLLFISGLHTHISTICVPVPDVLVCECMHLNMLLGQLPCGRWSPLLHINLHLGHLSSNTFQLSTVGWWFSFQFYSKWVARFCQCITFHSNES